MADDPTPPLSAPSPPEAQAPPPLRGPLAPTVLMKGGTLPSSFEAEMRRQSVAAEARRAAQDEDRKAASVPLEQGGAFRGTLDMGTPGKHPEVIIWCPTRDGTRERFMVCEVVQPEGADHSVLALLMICPRCVDRGVPSDQAQMMIRSNHRVWFLDDKTRGTPFKDPDTGHLHIIAGTVTGPGPYTCSGFNCGFRFRIDPKSEWPGVSRLVLE